MDADDALTAEIQAQVDEWSSNSNECFTIELIQNGKAIASFQPDFTYPIFGDEEAIFGYQNLSITLSFAAHNLQPHVSITHDRIFKAQGEVKPTEIDVALKDFLPEHAFSEQERDEALKDEDAASFTPPGDKIHSYTRHGQHFEIWCASLADSAALQLLQNMQILAPLFIDGGSILQLDHDWSTRRWKLFLLYRVDQGIERGSPYSLVGYGTSYRVFTLPDRQKPLQSDLDLFSQSLEDFLSPKSSTQTSLSPLDLPSRERLSQFLILPPYQRSGHGQELYHAMYTHLTTPPNIRELTVEDPSSAFDDLRDLCDLLHLRASNPSFASLRINTLLPPSTTPTIPTSLIIPLTTRTQIQSSTKITPRQFDRLVEMHTLSFIPPSHRTRSRITRKEKSSNEFDRAYYLWRLYVKERLYIFNRDQLAQVEREERIEKLEAALDGVQEGYVGLLERVERGERGDGGGWNGEGEGVVDGKAEVRKRKRKVIEDDFDEDEEGEAEDKEGEGEETGGRKVGGRKKVKV